jgi:hypothetical protein
MIRTADTKSFALQRNESNEDTICMMARGSSTKTEEEPLWVKRRRAGLISPKKQPKHFVPVTDTQPNSEGKKVTITPVKQKAVLRSDTQSNRFSPRHENVNFTPETPSSWSRKVKMTKMNFTGRPFPAATFLPTAPFVDSPRSTIPVVKMHDFASQRNNAKWMNDDNLLNIPVFQKRVEPYAILIQTHVRSMLARKSYRVTRENHAATTIQRIFRGHTVLITGSLQKFRAAKSIQKYARGHLGRLMGRMKKLEKHLNEVREDHAIQLQQIEKEKQEFFFKLNNDAEQDPAEEKFQLAHETVAALRESNRRLREENKELMADSHQLVQYHRTTEQATIQCFRNIDHLKQTIQKLVTDQQNLKIITGEFEKKFEEVAETAKHIDDMIAFERKISKIYIARIKDQITIINGVCGDKELANSIRIAALTGLEASKASLDGSLHKSK